MNNTLFFIILIVVGVFGLWFYIKKVKHLKLGNFILITGGVKSGKTLLATSLAIKLYKKEYLRYRIAKFLHPKQDIEMPLIYSNLPLNCDYVKLTTELLERQERFAYRSIILVSEASLVADSQNIKNMFTNNNLLLFNKLIAHETKGGRIIYETQSIEDCHYSIKRCISNYLYINSNISLPFFHMLDIRELVFENIGNVTNVFNNDAIEDTKKYFIRKKYHSNSK